MTRFSYPKYRHCSASPEQVAEFENLPSTPRMFRIICGPCVWKVHADVFKICNDGPMSWQRDRRDCNLSGEEEVILHNENVFFFARLLQFVYYGTYSHRSDEIITADANLSRPGYNGKSPCMIVLSGLTSADDPNYATLKSKDDTISRDFGHEVDLALYTLSETHGIGDLMDHSLSRYSSFPFRNHREFYYSIADKWPTFPEIEHQWSHWVYRAVLPHLAKFWKEAQIVIDNPHKVEAREIVNWVKGDGDNQRLLMSGLLDTLAGIDLDEQEDRENPCLIENCKKCGGPSKEEWSDSETDQSEAY